MGKEEIEQYAKAAQPAYLRPLQFFPAWQGVLTLAFSGFPPSFKKLKEDINENLAAAIPKESPGSMWPKMTLGALKDHVRLTPEMLDRISRICSEVSSDFDVCDPASKSQALLVDTLDISFYCARSLERQISCHSIQLQGAPCVDGSGTDTADWVDESPPSKEERDRIQGIVNEVHLPDYWFFASKDGNRETHYRGHALVSVLPFGVLSFL
ncbi:hypothetical protein DUNSADRAFT_11341 [Dunaliella salina]|uniref:Uncharacterized protein n=1 Tax=Dunaliella salina TaxID=3046 RepID=A0ABQ7GDK9_DUNSA|nr:hypothetical protein DUNSADRAFT_11341 [Dunaliella salina]|eukprot:KAF5832696.1 hypothetical protein DUNSADRAFT_11341 [Dunaliella salina]